MVRLDAYREVIIAYRKWLEAQRPSACKRFLSRLESPSSIHVEGAVGEAAAWNWLDPRCDSIELNESDAHGGADFRCVGNGASFLVEVTTITIPTASDRTGLSHSSKHTGPKYYGTATAAIKQEIVSKAKQVSGHTVPVLVFVTTLHWEVSAIGLQTHHLEELLIGSSVITSTINRLTGDSVGPIRNEATFDHSLFFATRTNLPLRRHISGVLVGGFGLRPPECVVRGVLHPDPARPFDPRGLTDACFGSIRPWPLTKQSRVVWRKSNGDGCDDATEQEERIEKARRNLHAAGLWDEIHRELRRRNDR
ncbi:MAG TPA: hypothetical protein PKE29_13580 [Phycisphaerales bacterium]|nr:hypothetical protein [Phycisphaerales bacterium]